MKKDDEIYNKIKQSVEEKIMALEHENFQLKSELTSANAKLSVYERIVSISNSKMSLGFEPPISKEGGND